MTESEIFWRNISNNLIACAIGESVSPEKADLVRAIIDTVGFITDRYDPGLEGEYKHLRKMLFGEGDL